MAKKLLILSVVTGAVGLAFVTGIVNVQNTVALYVALPLGAVFLGLFLMFQLFEKEMALYDEEQQTHLAYQKTETVEKRGSSRSSEGRGKSVTAH